MIKTYPKSKLFQSDGYWAKEPQQKSYPKSEPSYSEPVIWRWGVSYPATSENKAIPRDDFIGSPNFNRVRREPKDEYADDYKYDETFVHSEPSSQSSTLNTIGEIAFLIIPAICGAVIVSLWVGGWPLTIAIAIMLGFYLFGGGK